MNRRHILTKKATKKKRGLRQATYVSDADYKNVKGLLQS